MKLGEIYQSIGAWQKLAGINMKAGIAYKVLKYIKLVTAEYEIAEKQRVALIHEITGTVDGEDASIEPNTPEVMEYGNKVNVIMATESDLKLFAMDFKEVVDAVDEKDESLSIQDLSMLMPFFEAPE